MTALFAASVLACVGQPPPPNHDDGAGTTGSTMHGSSSSHGPLGSTSNEASSSTTPVAVDESSSAGSEPGSSSGMVDPGWSSSESTGGGVSTVGCADGAREALVDDALYPNLAACAGGFSVPGVVNGITQCGRQGGDDGPFPNGEDCTIDDLCADGWHLCASRYEVAAAGMADCDAEAWADQFFATAQSGEGANTCNDTGTQDVFGCGDLGYSMISGCAPLNRSTGNLCANLPGAWTCIESAYDEASFLRKLAPESGGALCCRDGM